MIEVHQLKINGEIFDVNLLDNGQVNYSFLRVDGEPVKSQTLRDVFWNRYLGQVYTAIRDEE